MKENIGNFNGTSSKNLYKLNEVPSIGWIIELIITSKNQSLTC
jgi:hypothetical protein